MKKFLMIFFSIIFLGPGIFNLTSMKASEHEVQIEKEINIYNNFKDKYEQLWDDIYYKRYEVSEQDYNEYLKNIEPEIISLFEKIKNKKNELNKKNYHDLDKDYDELLERIDESFWHIIED